MDPLPALAPCVSLPHGLSGSWAHLSWNCTSPAQARCLASLFNSTRPGRPSMVRVNGCRIPPPPTLTGPSVVCSHTLLLSLSLSHTHTWGHTQQSHLPSPGQPKPIQPRSPSATLTLGATHLWKYLVGGVFKAGQEDSGRLDQTPLLSDTSRGQALPHHLIRYCTLPTDVSPWAPRALTASSISLGVAGGACGRSHLPWSPR